MEEDYIESNGEKIYFYIRRKDIKNINLKVNIDKKVTLSIPKKMPLDKAKDFVKKKANWIRKKLDFYDTFAKQKEKITFENGEIVYLLGKQYKMKIISDTENNIIVNNKYMEIHIKEKYIKSKNYIKNFYEKWLKQYAFNIFEELVIKYQEKLKQYGVKIPEIEVKQMKTRWGSCIPAYNKVIFNLSLIKTPICCIEYVVLHELSHFKHQNHSKNFYNFITIFMPDWKERKKILDEEFMGVV
mgnify:CR=1 FL=1